MQVVMDQLCNHVNMLKYLLLSIKSRYYFRLSAPTYNIYYNLLNLLLYISG